MPTKITNPEDLVFLREHIKDADALIESDDLNSLLSPLDNLISREGLDEDYCLNAFGAKAQRIYDRLYYDNVDE